MILLFSNIISNYALMLDSFVGLEYIVAFGVVVTALAFIYSLGHKKTF